MMLLIPHTEFARTAVVKWILSRITPPISVVSDVAMPTLLVGRLTYGIYLMPLLRTLATQSLRIPHQQVPEYLKHFKLQNRYHLMMECR